MRFILSPLHNFYMGKTTKEANESQEDLDELILINEQSIIHLRKLNPQNHTTRLNNRCDKCDMKISTEKSELMKINRISSPLNISVNNKENINWFRNLNMWKIDIESKGLKIGKKRSTLPLTNKHT